MTRKSDPLIMLALVILFALVVVAGILYVITDALQGMHVERFTT